MKIWWLFFLPFLGTVISSAEAKLGDRLLIEVNRHAVSQRYMESYMAVKTILSPYLASSSKSSFVTRENWKKSLREFRGDLVVSLEAKRLGRFTPTRPLLAEMMIVIRRHLAESKEYRTILDRLGVDADAHLPLVADIIQVDRFRSSKSSSSSDRRNTWLDLLEEKHVIRFFVNSDKYQHINPVVASP